jgi:hypothetical protein
LINTIPAILDGHFSPLPFATRRGTHLLAYFTVMDQQQSRMTQVHGYSAEFSMDLASSSGFGEVFFGILWYANFVNIIYSINSNFYTFFSDIFLIKISKILFYFIQLKIIKNPR